MHQTIDLAQVARPIVEQQHFGNFGIEHERRRLLAAACEPLPMHAIDPIEEIAATLDDQGFNRGLSFDREMLPYCGGTFRVKDRVERLIDEKTGRMLKIPKDCLILDDVVCSGELSTGRWFCPRRIYAFWREAWVERVEHPERAPESGVSRPRHGS